MQLVLFFLIIVCSIFATSTVSIYYFTFTTVTPNPVVSNTNLTLLVASTAVVEIAIVLTCFSDQTIYPANSNEFTQILIPSNYAGNCSLEAQLDQGFYVPPELAYVTIQTAMTFTDPVEDTYIVAGSDLLTLVDLGNPDMGTTTLAIELSKNSEFILLGEIYPTESTNLTVPSSYPRGPADLFAFSFSPYIQPQISIPFFINTSVTFLTPTSGSSFPQMSSIPVQLYASDGLSVTGTVQMTCPDTQYSSTQTVQSTTPTYFAVTTASLGTCSFEIVSLFDEYTSIASESSVQVTITALKSPTGGILYPLTYEQITVFASSFVIRNFDNPLSSFL